MSSIWLLLSFVAATQARNSEDHVDGDEFEWPTKYHVKAIKKSLTDNVIERYEVWKTAKNSRIDYNDGYVKSFVLTGKTYDYSLKYVITLNEDLEDGIQTGCNAVAGDANENPALESILPEESDNYIVDGSEVVNEKDCVRFKYESTEAGTDARKTVWAVYESGIWIPVRYEVIEFDTWLGSKDKHEIWTYYDFHRSFFFSAAFDADTYNCTGEFSSLKSMQLKDLLFVDPDKPDLDIVFAEYQKRYKRKYINLNEPVIRRNIFKKNLRYIIQNNRRQAGYRLGINQFTDRTPEEINKYKGLRRRSEGKTGNIAFPYDENKINEMAKELPVEYDLRLLGFVTSVKNQEDCAADWTLGTTATVEGALARFNSGKLTPLSNQAIIDCAWGPGAAGCDGGSDYAAYDWIMQHGIPLETEYGPFTNKEGPCKLRNMTLTHTITGFTDVIPMSIRALKVALIYHGPISVSVDASPAFLAYSSGIFYDPDCSPVELNHGLVLVGYGEINEDTYWILKNSWGSSWGMEGYIYISARDNNCGVATEPSYVVI